MAYRRTERVARRLAARRDAILAAAEAAVAEGGIAAVQIAPVAERAGVAAGTVYRYFPSKDELVKELLEQAGAREIAAIRQAAAAAPGPLSAIAAAVSAVGTFAVANRKLASALLTEPAALQSDVGWHSFRHRLVAELERLISAATAAGLLTAEPAGLAAPALVGAIPQGLVGPAAHAADTDPAGQRAAVQSVTLMALRALGVPDAHARGLVVQCALPSLSQVAGSAV